MEIPVLIERVANNGYRVSGMTPFPFAVEAQTKEEALDKAREVFEKRADEVGSISLAPPAARKSWGGYLKDEPLFDAWQAAIQAYRDKVDAEDDRP